MTDSFLDENPANYKFLGLKINIKDTQKVINRTNLDFYTWAEDFGGLIEVLTVVIGIFMSTFSAK